MLTQRRRPAANPCMALGHLDGLAGQGHRTRAVGLLDIDEHPASGDVRIRVRWRPCRSRVPQGCRPSTKQRSRLCFPVVPTHQLDVELNPVREWFSAAWSRTARPSRAQDDPMRSHSMANTAIRRGAHRHNGHPSLGRHRTARWSDDRCRSAGALAPCTSTSRPHPSQRLSIASYIATSTNCPTRSARASITAASRPDGTERPGEDVADTRAALHDRAVEAAGDADDASHRLRDDVVCGPSWCTGSPGARITEPRLPCRTPVRD